MTIKPNTYQFVAHANVILLMLALTIVGSHASAQNVIISDTGGTPDPSAMLDIRSLDQGLLVPRMTKSQRDAISNPAQGLVIFQTNLATGLWMYDTNASGWELLATASSGLGIDSVLSISSDAKGDSIYNLASLSLSTDSTGYADIQIDSFLTFEGNGANGVSFIGHNFYSDDTSYRYLNTGEGSVLAFGSQFSGLFYWPSGNQFDQVPDDASAYIRLNDSTITLQAERPDNAIELKGHTEIDSLNIGDYTMPTDQGANLQVLTTDGSGVASWQDSQTDSDWVVNGQDVYNDGDSVGIGTDNPEYRLHVRGNQTPQVHIEPKSVNGESTVLMLSGARNSSTTTNNATIRFQNYDSDLSDYNLMGGISGRVSNSTTNVGDMVFYNYADGNTGSESMRLTKDGELGINIASPEADVHINHDEVRISTPNNFSGTTLEIFGQRHNSGSGFATIDFRNLDSSDGNSEYSGAKIESTNAGNSDDGDLNFYTTNNSTSALAMTIEQNGDVGIGTGSLNGSRKLQIHEGTGTSSLMQLSTASSGSAVNDGFNIGYVNSLGGVFMLAENQTMQWGTNNSYNMWLDETGNLGIGQSNPSVKLQVDGGSDASLSGGGYIMTNIASSTNIIIDDNEIIARNNGAEAELFINNDGGGITFQGGQGGGTQVVIQDDGDVGIGESAPQASLDVHDIAVIGDIDVGTQSTFQASSNENGEGFITSPWIYSHALHSPSERGASGTSVIVGNEGNIGANNEINLVTNGSSRLVVESDGEVGIGTNVTTNAMLTIEDDGGDLNSGIQFSTSTGDDWYIYQDGSQGLKIRDDGTDRAVFTSVGRMGIGELAPSHILHINGQGRSSSALWATTSDLRAKQNIKTLESATETLLKFRPVTYEWKPEFKAKYQDEKPYRYGFISQEVEKIIPQMVSEIEETTPTDTIADFKVLDQEPLVPLLVRAFQEQQEQIEALKAQNESLTNDLKALKSNFELSKKYNADLTETTRP